MRVHTLKHTHALTLVPSHTQWMRISIFYICMYEFALVSRVTKNCCNFWLTTPAATEKQLKYSLPPCPSLSLSPVNESVCQWIRESSILGEHSSPCQLWGVTSNGYGQREWVWGFWLHPLASLVSWWSLSVCLSVFMSFGRSVCAQW